MVREICSHRAADASGGRGKDSNSDEARQGVKRPSGCNLLQSSDSLFCFALQNQERSPSKSPSASEVARGDPGVRDAEPASLMRSCGSKPRVQPLPVW
ncbi:unnamed protein product [Lampetra fluviatilis]